MGLSQYIPSSHRLNHCKSFHKTGTPMQRLFSLVLMLCITSVILTTGCRKDSNNPVDGGNNKPTVTTTIIGVVSDEAGKGMSGVSVSAHGKTALTNENGLFIIKDARVPQDRCFILASRDG